MGIIYVSAWIHQSLIEMAFLVVPETVTLPVSRELRQWCSQTTVYPPALYRIGYHPCVEPCGCGAFWGWASC